MDQEVPTRSTPGYCFELINVDQYPAYRFVFLGGLEWNTQEITRDTCIAFPYNDSPKVIAIPREQFNEANLRANADSPSAIVADFQFQHPMRDPQNLPRESITEIIDQLFIDQLEENSFKIVAKSVAYEFEGSKPQQVEYTVEGNRPLPLSPASSADPLLPLASAVIILVILFIVALRMRLFRKRKKSQAHKKIVAR